MGTLPHRRPPAPAGSSVPVAEPQSAWGRPVSLRIGEVVTGLALLACAAFFAWRALLLPFGTVGLPGPGFFPFALAVVLGLLAVAIVLYAVREVDALERIFLGHRDVLVAIAALVGVAIAFERGDSYLILGAFMVAMLVTVGRTQWWRAVLGAGIGMVAVWAVFNRALGVRLPAGQIWDYWGYVAGPASVAAPF
jgi:putative tricarboxylic transport membrane protein